MMRACRPELVLTLMVLAAGPARAVDSDSPHNGYALMAWTTEKGLPPGDVLAMCQELNG